MLRIVAAAVVVLAVGIPVTVTQYRKDTDVNNRNVALDFRKRALQVRNTEFRAGPPHISFIRVYVAVVPLSRFLTQSMQGYCNLVRFKRYSAV
jgi:hypothetical protein